MGATFPLQAIWQTMQQGLCYLPWQSSLNLPAAQSLEPLGSSQRLALNLILSNSPISLVSGLPGSGKTHIGRLAIHNAIAHQKSTLVIADHPQVLTAYQNLSPRPIQLGQPTDSNYRETVIAWLRTQLAQPSINLLPPHLLPDLLWEALETRNDRQRWLDLARQGDITCIEENLQEVFPQTSSARLRLLAYRLQKSVALMEQWEQLRQSYTSLSQQGIQDLADAIVATATIPILCPLDQFSQLSARTFDLVIVEEADRLDQPQLEKVAQLANKLVLLGEPGSTRTPFNILSHRLLPAYRLELQENYRLHPHLARVIFSELYDRQPYVPLVRSYIPSPTPNGRRLIWHDIRNPDHIPQKFGKILETYTPEHGQQKRLGILTLSRLSNFLHPYYEGQQQTIFSLKAEVDAWYGRDCEILVVICDGTQPTLPQLKLALSRASDLIYILGDQTQYAPNYQKGQYSVFTPLFEAEAFELIRETVIT